MEKELINFIKENELNPFNLYKTPVKVSGESIFKTRDGKIVHNKVLSYISNNFSFSDTSNLFNCFLFTRDIEEIRRRQNFFKNINRNLKNDFLKDLKKPRPVWKPNYGIVVVTDNEDTFTKLKKLDIPVKFIINEDDVRDLENYEIVQVVDVEQFSYALEQLPQTVFLDSIDDVYLERYLEILSGWIDNFNILDKIENDEIKNIINELRPLFELIGLKGKEKISRDYIEDKIEIINEDVSNRIKDLNISGEILFNMLSQGKLPKEIQDIIEEIVEKNNIPEQICEIGIPVKIDDNELERFMRLQDANQNTDFAEKIKRNSKILKEVPEKIEKINYLLLMYDFISGISQFIEDCEYLPTFSNAICINNSKNIFLEKAQAISFRLDGEYRCSILTGANSGGKTTLIEHIIQLIGLSNLGVLLNGKIEMPIFSEVYYFAKNKGSASKGAFETLLTQMGEIKTGQNTLILADEIESVTEPGVAGKIIAATADYFIKKNCFLVIATHLGQEIQKFLPDKCRIDGIEAKGLDENNELIVDHNPVIGRLANSTPELIVEKMAKSNHEEYFIYLNEYLKNSIVI